MKETNMEHFRGEIEKLGFNIGINIADGKLIRCEKNCSSECEAFHGVSCKTHITKWLMSEYKPEPVLTAREKHFVEFAQEGWLARDADNSLWWYEDKPIRACMTKWSYRKFARKLSDKPYNFEQCFRFITWEDEEAWSVEELRKLKVQE